MKNKKKKNDFPNFVQNFFFNFFFKKKRIFLPQKNFFVPKSIFSQKIALREPNGAGSLFHGILVLTAMSIIDVNIYFEKGNRGADEDLHFNNKQGSLNVPKRKSN